jgi:hypothetical protein
MSTEPENRTGSPATLDGPSVPSDRLEQSELRFVDSKPRATSRFQKPVWWVAAALAALAVIVFLPAVRNGFVDLDDDHNFIENPYFRGFGLQHIAWAWTTFRLGVYQPLSWMLLEAEYSVWDLGPRGYHAASLVLHTLNTTLLDALVLAVLHRAVPDLGPRDRATLHIAAAVAVALFAVHPLRTEVVVWVSCQPYLPCAFFMMLSVMAYLRSGGDGRPGGRRWLAASYALALAALLSKAVAIMLPAILLVLDIDPQRRLGPGRWWGRSARAT